jgi:hypothetical protein
MRIIGILLLGLSFFMTAEANALELRDCDAKNIARSTALKSTVGVGTGCGAKKEARKAKEDVVDHGKDAKEGATDKAKNLTDRDK